MDIINLQDETEREKTRRLSQIRISQSKERIILLIFLGLTLSLSSEFSSPNRDFSLEAPSRFIYITTM